MSKGHTPKSRVSRLEKRRKSTKMMARLAGTGSLIAIALISFMVFSGEDSSGNAKQMDDSLALEEESKESGQEDQGDIDTSDDGFSNEVSTSNREVEKKVNKGEKTEDKEINVDTTEEVMIEESNDENVKRVIKKDWKPVITKQEIEGEHVINYDNSQSQDWQELLQAVRNATGLSEDNMITWWVEGKGPQRAVATVTNKAQTKILRVNIEWVEGKGYKPSRLEVLKENDVKHKAKEESGEV